MRDRPVLCHGAPPKRRQAGWFATAFSAFALFSLPAVADPPAPVVDLATTPASLTPFAGDTAIEDRLAAPGRVVVAGEHLHDRLVRQFYAAQGWKTVWDRHPDTAAAFISEVSHADRHGLDPALFHVRMLRGYGRALTPVERDLVLSDAILSYADALAEGAMPVGARPEDEDLHPQPVDTVAAIEAAIAAPDPAQAVEALAPDSPDYLALQRAYLEYVEAAASATSETTSRSFRPRPRLAVADALRRARQIAVNLERRRWLPREMPADRLVVDATISQLQLFRGDMPVFTTRVVVGEFDKQTPELQSLVKDVLFNPPWNIPPSIVRKEILPKLAANRHYLADHHMRWRGPLSIQQEAGPHSALGRLKFEMDDRFDVYLHDTPEKWRFQSVDRMMSHGCVRVENPRQLAALLLGAEVEAVDRGINTDRTHRRALPHPIPVFIVYRTAVAESDGSIAFRSDPYARDPEIWAYLSRARQLPLAQRSGIKSADRVRTGPSTSTVTQKTAAIGN
jgi:murein L,D-transpeptidase YcbB/YkuD